MALKSNGGPGWQAAIERLQQKVRSGAHAAAGFQDGETYPDGTPVAQVAAWDEFGTKTAPPRSFMRKTITDHKAEWPKLLAAALKATNYDVDKALGMVGEKMAAQIREEIASIDGPANAPLTNLLKDRFPMGGYSIDDLRKAANDIRKGVTAPAGKPLVWSGQMLRSVTSQVKEGATDD